LKLQNVRTGTRVVAGFGLILFVLVALTVVGIARVAKINASLATINDVNSVKETYAIAFRGSVHNRAIALRDVTIVPSAELPAVLLQIKQLGDAYQEAAGPLYQMVAARSEAADREQAALADIKVNETRTLPLIADVIAKQQGGDMAGAQRVLLGQARPAFVDWLNSIDRFIGLEEQLNKGQANAARHVGLTFQLLMLVLTGLAIAVGGAIAYWLTRDITRALGGEPAEVKRLADAIRNGDLSHEVQVRPGDDVSILATMERMRDALRGVVEGVQQHANGVSTASIQIAQGNADLSTRTVAQGASLQQTTASMAQLTNTVKQNSNSAKQASAVATAAADVAARGSETVQSVVETMDGISSSSERMAEIISVIEGIAFQTNILALNAAVEAARAGEQGRGFAVVASEVRSLAQRAGTAAKEIKVLIDESVQRVYAGSSRVRDAGTTMGEILQSVRRVNEIMAEIASASDEQNAGIERVGQAIMQMDDATQQNAALVEQASTAARLLEEQAQALREAVAVFKVGNTGLARAASRDTESNLRPDTIN
jgi:methyl-accepting chemotaxis protein